MAREYIKRAVVTVNGVEIKDFDGVTISGVTVSERVPTMNGRGYARDLADPGVTINEMRSASPELADLTGLFNAIIVVAPVSSTKRFTFNGCHTMEIGDESFGRDDVAKRDIELGAESVTEEG